MATLCDSSVCTDRDVQIDDETFSVLKAIIPSGYKYMVCKCYKTGQDSRTNGFQAIFRVNISSKEEFIKWWKEDFHESSLTTMRLKRTYPTAGERVLYHVDLRCQHNTCPRSSTADLRKNSKNTHCPATATVRVCKTKGLSRPLSSSKDPHIHEYPTIINMAFTHNHPVDVADALKFRDVSVATRKKLEELLLSGYRPAAAINLYKYDLQQEDPEAYVYKSADRAQCPDKQYVYRLAYSLFSTYYGQSRTSEEQLLALREYVEKMNKSLSSECLSQLGNSEELQRSPQTHNETQQEPDIIQMEVTDDNQIVVAICTQMMRRVHKYIENSGEMIFVDASGNMDRTQCRVFVLLTHSIVGGLPLGVLITTNETQQTLMVAFRLLGNMLGADAFHGRGARGPMVIMTDDCKAERQALQASYPESTLLLCCFHVLQAFWRFLWDAKNQVPKSERPHLFHLLKDMLYSSSEENLSENFSKAESDVLLAKHIKVNRYLASLYQRRKEWAICCRSTLPVRGNNTNNFVEAAMRVLKDQVLMRTKAFNIVQLADFIILRMNSYYQRRCIDAANNRTQEMNKKYLANSKMVHSLQVKQLGATEFEVSSLTDQTTVYTVDMSAGFCSCHMGCTGGPCKHQAFVMKEFCIPSRNFMPTFDVNMRQLLNKLATGESVDLSWFCNLRPQAQQTTAVDSQISDLNVASEASIDYQPNATTSNTLTTEETYNSDDDFDLSSQDHLLLGQYDKMMKEIKLKFNNNKEQFREPLRQMVASFSKIKTDSHLVSAMMCFGKYSGVAVSLSSERKRLLSNKTIGVQPTAKQRRKLLSGGKHSARVGRPLKSSKLSSISRLNGACLPPRKKAQHSLQECVQANCSLGKNHSSK